MSEKVEYFEMKLSYMIEGVAIMIVTTCAIPICVLFLFTWILKMVTSVNINLLAGNSLPKASKLLTKKDANEFN